MASPWRAPECSPRLGVLVLGVLLAGCEGVVSGLGSSSGPDASALVDAGPSGAPDASVTNDAGTSADAGASVDAGADAGLTGGGDAGACPSDAILCESFEGGLDTARWGIRGDVGAFTVDTTTPTPAGRASLHLAYGVPYSHVGEQALDLKTLLAAPDDRMYLRAYLRFGDLSLPGAHPAFLYVTDGIAELGFGSISNDFATLGWGTVLDNARAWYEGGTWHPGVEDGDATPDSEQGLLAKQWICVEIMYFGDHQSPTDTSHPNEQVTVWINGTERPELAASDALWQGELGSGRTLNEHWSPVYDKAHWRFGLESFGPQHVALDLWFDAIVFSHSRIGCLP